MSIETFVNKTSDFYIKELNAISTSELVKKQPYIYVPSGSIFIVNEVFYNCKTSCVLRFIGTGVNALCICVGDMISYNNVDVDSENQTFAEVNHFKCRQHELALYSQI